ncbi:hypothetical protein MPER_07834 [Moniliophthora perniciosa FA553]|nr:hypothetical protein MPER_07834 [Moniliophthora perniciosa FA553]
MVEDSLVNLRVSQSVQVVALELDSAVHVPICPSRLCFYKAHPKVVFVMKQGVYSEMMSTLSWTHEMELVQELCVMFDMKEVDRLYLWDVVEKKVSERWNNFITGVRSQMAWMGQVTK